MGNGPHRVAEDLSRLLRELGIDPLSFPVGMNMVQLSDAEAALMDERARRVAAGTATEDDLDAQNATLAQLRRAPSLPPIARVPLGPPAPAPAEDVARVVSLGVPALIAERIAAATGFEDTPAMACARSFYADRIGVLVLVGERGCGKSFAAAWWLVHAHHRPPPIIRGKTTPRRFIECNAIQLLTPHAQADMAMAMALVLDDAGTEPSRRADDVATCIARRYASALPTVVTTNLNRRDFGATYGQRIMDRLDEVGRFEVVGRSSDESLRARMRRW